MICFKLWLESGETIHPSVRCWVDGECERYAANLVKKHSGSVVWLDELPGHDKFPTFMDHQVAFINGKYYDVLNPEGVVDWKELNFVKWTLDGSMAKRLGYDEIAQLG